MQEHRPYGMNAYVAQDGVVYRDRVLELAATPPPASGALGPRGGRGAHPARRPAKRSRAEGAAAEDPADGPETPFHPMLILIPLRLGLDYMNEIYEPALKAPRGRQPRAG